MATLGHRDSWTTRILAHFLSKSWGHSVLRRTVRCTSTPARRPLNRRSHYLGKRFTGGRLLFFECRRDFPATHLFPDSRAHLQAPSPAVWRAMQRCSLRSRGRGPVGAGPAGACGWRCSSGSCDQGLFGKVLLSLDASGKFRGFWSIQCCLMWIPRQPSNCEYLKKWFYTACESSLSDPLQFPELSKQNHVARDEIVAKPSGVFFPRNCHPLDFILN